MRPPRSEFVVEPLTSTRLHHIETRAAARVSFLDVQRTAAWSRSGTGGTRWRTISPDLPVIVHSVRNAATDMGA